MNHLCRIVAILWLSSSIASSRATAFATGLSRTAFMTNNNNDNNNNGNSVKQRPYHRFATKTSHISISSLTWRLLRGGDQEQDFVAVGEDVMIQQLQQQQENDKSTDAKPIITATKANAASTPGSILSNALAIFASIGRYYSTRLESRPIITKSCTAGIIFGLSDYIAQSIERQDTKDVVAKFDWKRLVSSTLVGLLYFGPAAHYWYEWIFQLIPQTTLVATLYKAFWGQLLFGPSFTCVFFAASLIQSGDFTFKAWYNKIKSDLFGTWMAGIGYWPIVDLISYSVIPIKLIPLFVNMASLIWTIYLSIVANRGKGKIQ